MVTRRNDDNSDVKATREKILQLHEDFSPQQKKTRWDFGIRSQRKWVKIHILSENEYPKRIFQAQAPREGGDCLEKMCNVV